jgi:hypothetical protein
MKHILENTASASSNGRSCGEYRAIVVCGDDGAIIRLEQPFGNNERWGAAGSWYLETLFNEGKGHSDGISIDFGQKWQVDSGMRAIINEAILFCVGLVNEDEEREASIKDAALDYWKDTAIELGYKE